MGRIFVLSDSDFLLSLWRCCGGGCCILRKRSGKEKNLMNAKKHLKQRNTMSEIPSHTSLWFFYAVRQALHVKRKTLHRKAQMIGKASTPYGVATPTCLRCGDALHETIFQELYPN
jgi:hypothetical protein